MLTPKDRNDVQGVLGIINYMAKFIPNLSNMTELLRKLLQNKTRWHCEERHNQVVKEIKTLLKSKNIWPTLM